ITLEYLNRFLADEDKLHLPDLTKAYAETKYTLKEAKEKFPEWYERRILKGIPQKKWSIKRDLYDWWKRQIIDGASGGHRYFCIMTLAIYAIKCDVSYEELERSEEHTSELQSRFDLV